MYGQDILSYRKINPHSLNDMISVFILIEAIEIVSVDEKVNILYDTFGTFYEIN